MIRGDVRDVRDVRDMGARGIWDMGYGIRTVVWA